jgi:hypothetical protein
MVTTKQKRRHKVMNPTTTLSEVEVENKQYDASYPALASVLPVLQVANIDRYDNTKRVGVIAKVTCSALEKVELGKAQMQYTYVSHKLVTDNNAE